MQMEIGSLGAILEAMLPSEIRHIRAVRQVDFPSSDPEWELGENSLHQCLCEALRAILRVVAGASHATVGSDQFMYFDASNPRRKCAPDAFVKLGVPFKHFDSWKTWKGGVPELCVEIVSSPAEEKLTLDEKLARFHTMGVGEVIAYDPLQALGSRLRAWDLIGGDLVERIVEAERTPCVTLDKWFVVAPAADFFLEGALRLAHDPLGTDLILLPLEAERAALERERTIAERERAALRLEQAAKEAALLRISELEAALARTK